MEKQRIFVGIRNVDEEIYRKFRAWVIQNKLNIGFALSEAIKIYLDQMNMKIQKLNKEQEAFRKLIKLKPLDLGPGTERLSEEIDDILYGSKR